MFELGLRPAPGLSLELLTHCRIFLPEDWIGAVIPAVTTELYSSQTLCMSFREDLKGSKFSPGGMSRGLESEGMQMKSNLNMSHD